jgi:hypothetical protein
MRSSSVRLLAALVLAVMLAGAMHWIGAGPDGSPPTSHHAPSSTHGHDAT